MTRFDSRLVYEQLVRTVSVDVPVTGTIPPNSERRWVSQWYDMEFAGSTIRADVFIPGTTYAPTIVNGKVQVPCQIIYDNASFLGCYPVIEVSGNQWRASIHTFNPYTTTEPSPNRTFSFIVREYLPPTN